MRLQKNKMNRSFFAGVGLGLLALAVIAVVGMIWFEKKYQNRIYPGVAIDGVPVGGWTLAQAESFWQEKNQPFADKTFEFSFENQIATISARTLEMGYDAKLSATQAYLVGRSGLTLSDLHSKFVKKQSSITPYFRWNTKMVEDLLAGLAASIDIPAEDALFNFKSGRVSSFRPSKIGRRLNITNTNDRFAALIKRIPRTPQQTIIVPVVVDTIYPKITTDEVNDLGIKELIGRGYSEFAGSIPGRIHNVVLAASRINGVLIAPGETFSFTGTIGDISAATGYQSAYIIKDGRTVLGDGGGVCQVSTTLFRAALNAGLPISERHAHAYRVHYYEEAGYKPGLDATVFSPSVDLKIKNDTPAHILIQAKPDTNKLALTFELYGTNDGRKAEIFDHQVWSQTPPPPALYQDDPTLRAGVIKQVDWSSWGAKTSFKYRVTRNHEVLQDTSFSSNFRPWQAVYLRRAQ